MTRHDLIALLQDISADVAEVDLGERSWRGAEVRRARSRRRAAGGVAAAAAVVVAGYAWLGPTGSDGGPPGPSQLGSSSSVTSSSTGAWRAAADGTPYTEGPAVGAEDSLPWLDVGLPREIGSELPRKKLSDLGGLPTLDHGVVSAVYLDAADGRNPQDARTFHPVVVLSGGIQVVVDTVSLDPVTDAAGNAHTPLDARAVDGLRLAFAQPGAVVVVDLRTASVVRIPIPDPHVEWASWTRTVGDLHILARSADAVWLVDPDARTVTRRSGGKCEARAGHYALVADPGGATLEEIHDDVCGVTDMPWPMIEPWGDTMGATSTDVGWVASAAFLGDTTTKGLDVTMPYQGLVAMPVSGPSPMGLL
ncbi:MAG TPA: hypothetical protein VFG98_09575, partial [Intrasporangium sp.]|nr:hypothetical protein [Intrasporangium sp.]